MPKTREKKSQNTVSVWSDSFYPARCTTSLLSAPSDSKTVTWIHCDACKTTQFITSCRHDKCRPAWSLTNAVCLFIGEKKPKCYNKSHLYLSRGTGWSGTHASCFVVVDLRQHLFMGLSFSNLLRRT